MTLPYPVFSCETKGGFKPYAIGWLYEMRGIQ